mgnify:CR=1 FL=1
MCLPAFRNRLIPAHAGSTVCDNSGQPLQAAHPRSRGEHAMSTSLGRVSGGSSPLTRGARARARLGTIRERLIPAHAGSTVGDPTSAASDWAHPRSRGEHNTLDLEPMRAAGSSPLTRGAPNSLKAAPSSRRLIPAHAGSTLRGAAPRNNEPAHPRSRGEHKPSSTSSLPRSGSSPLTRGAPSPFDVAG